MKLVRISDLSSIRVRDISDNDLMYIIDNEDSRSNKIKLGELKKYFDPNITLPNSDLSVDDGNYITGIHQVDGKIESLDQKILPEVILPTSDLSVDDGNYITGIHQVDGKIESLDQKMLPNYKYKLLNRIIKDSGDVLIEDHAINNIIINTDLYHPIRTNLVLPKVVDEYARKFYLRFEIKGSCEITISGSDDESVTLEGSNDVFNDIVDKMRTYTFLECRRKYLKGKPYSIFLVIKHNTDNILHT